MRLGFALLLAVAVLIGVLAWRRRRLDDAFERMLAERRLRLQPHCPLADPFVYPDIAGLRCYEGELQGGVRVTLILGHRRREGSYGPAVGTGYGPGPGQRMIVDYYVGVYLPKQPAVDVGDVWLERWQRQVAERGDGWAGQTAAVAPERPGWGVMGPPESLPIRAIGTDDGGVLLAWHCLHQRAPIEVRLGQVRESLRAIGVNERQVRRT